MRHVAVDWSGAKSPAGKIWLAEAVAGRLVRLETFATRELVVECIAAFQQRDEPTVVGLDFSFSFPAWFCRDLGARSVVDVWREVAVKAESWLGRCPSPFWGRPGCRRPTLPAHLRRTEERVGSRLKVRPKSTFQIGGAGAVGTGSLRGMPHLLTLLEAGCAVWPFDAPGHVTLVEIYPRMLTGAVTKSSEAARVGYLQRIAFEWSAGHRYDAERSDDAFDAAVSAVVMSARWSPWPEVGATDDVTMIEGEIWNPDAAGQSVDAS